MSPLEEEIKNFYSSVKFQGTYSAEEVIDHGDYLIYERYLRFFETHNVKTVLDVGCGTGFITNIIAHNFPHIKITAIDFSDAIDHGKKIAKEVGNKNIKWKKIDFFKFKSEPYDLVLCNGSIHHMPEFDKAVEKVKSFSKKYIMIGLYNKYGKWIQRKVYPKFITREFELDQMKIPFELSFTHKQALGYFKEFKLVHHTPSILGFATDFISLFRGKWGGFMFYYFER